MRWFVMIVALLVGLSVGLTWMHPAPRTVGRELAEAMESDGAGRLRGAVMRMEYVPEEEAMERMREEPVRRGEEALVGATLREVLNQRSTKWADASFTWSARKGEILRGVYGEDGAGRNAVKKSLSKLDWPSEARTVALNRAAEELAALTDGALRERWLRADRATLVQQADLVQAVEEAMLLAAEGEVETGGIRAAVDFSSGGVRVVGLPLDGETGQAWVKLYGYGAEGTLAWSGVLLVEGKDGAPPAADRVRLLMAAAAEDASGRGASDRSSPP